MYEKKKILKFKPGQLVLKCHPRSPLSKENRNLYSKEYGSEIKEEVNKTLSQADAAMNEKLAKLSPLGSFFNMIKQRELMVDQQERKKSKKHHHHHHHHSKDPLTRQKTLATSDHDHEEREEPLGEPPKTLYRSVCIVLEGSADVISPYEPDFRIFELS